ncbi:MAG: ATP-binding protein, partial [Archangium sp.]|nr:ATP-binding protein [Archangium sp.]
MAKRSGGIVDELVHQFTDPFAFYRELIQNSIDAGSTRIEVSLRYTPGNPKGLALISVADWGEGMNREVIENYLVTKFRSTKENDLTKIGKFGIGFVSIFACAPDLITVDTSRDGESWRVLFKTDTTWELLRLDEPLEGTRITLHKELSGSEYEEFVTRSRESLSRWCKHSDADVVFTAGRSDGSPPPPAQPVKEPLAVDAPFQVEHQEEGTHIIAGPSRTEPPVTGMYNRGLTLLETKELLVPGVTLKIVSRYLEHTLTRDDVRRDKHFSRAMELAATLVDEKLIPRVSAELKTACERKDGSKDASTLFEFARARLKPKDLWWRLTGGGAISHDDLLAHVKREGFATISEKRSPLVERLLDAKWPVLELTPGTEASNEALALLKTKRAVEADTFFTYAAPPERPTSKPFASALLELLKDAGAGIEEVEVSTLRGAEAEEEWALLDALSRPVTLERARSSPFVRGCPKVLLLNDGHEAV